MYPISNYQKAKRGYRHGDKTFYSSFHLGIDLIVPTGTPIIAPFDGTAKRVKGTQGGNMIYFYADDLVFRFLHLDRYAATGAVTEGTLIGYSGNTGLSTGPHIHLDISPAPFSLSPKEKFIDPDKFIWHQPEEDPVDCKDERINARADAMRFAWESWFPGDKVTMESIYKEARGIEDGTLNQRDLINGWKKTSLEKRYFIKRSEFSERVDELKKEASVLRQNLYAADDEIRRQDDEIDQLRGNINVLSDKVIATELKLKDCKADATKSLSISDHLKAIWSLLRGEK